MIKTFSEEVSQGQRFEFGSNWKNFLKVLSTERIAQAEGSLKKILQVDNLEGQTFLDIGCGSGLFPLAARRLGVTVHSFDYDPESVSCATQLKERFFPADDEWIVERGSVLDKEYMESFNEFDIVYAWGVLHHTGDMWKALDLASIPVKNNGMLYTAIYNKQKLWSHY